MMCASREPAPSGRAPGFFWEETADQTDMCAPGLRAAFARMGAIWTHSVFLPRGDGLEIARAVESDPERDNPSGVVSPVYQEIQRHESAMDRALCLLLTGTLFHHHFSAVVTLGPDHDQPDGLILDFDVADRCRSAVEHLAATYTVKLHSGAIADANQHAISWEKIGPDECRLELIAIAPSTLAMAEAGRSATRVQILADIQPESYTHRLRYRWRWTSRSGLTR
jgi:hypothetical protein